MSTAVSCASCDAVQCPEVASEASSLYQFSSMVLHVAPGDTDFQPDSSPFWDSLPVWITQKYCGYCLQQETLTEIGGEWGHPKFSKPGFSNTWTVNFHMFKLVLEKAEEPEIKLSTSAGWSTSMRVQKNIYFCFIDYAEAFDCVDHNKLWKILKDGNTRPPNLPVEKSVCMSGSNS